jgi:hypothetical protein
VVQVNPFAGDGPATSVGREAREAQARLLRESQSRWPWSSRRDRIRQVLDDALYQARDPQHLVCGLAHLLGVGVVWQVFRIDRLAMPPARAGQVNCAVLDVNERRQNAVPGAVVKPGPL